MSIPRAEHAGECTVAGVIISCFSSKEVLSWFTLPLGIVIRNRLFKSVFWNLHWVKWSVAVSIETTAPLPMGCQILTAELGLDGDRFCEHHFYAFVSSRGKSTKWPWPSIQTALQSKVFTFGFFVWVGGNLSSWRLWVRCFAPKSSQDLLHSSWRRWPWNGAHWSVSSGLLISGWLWRQNGPKLTVLMKVFKCQG